LAAEDPFAGPMLCLVENEMLVVDKRSRSSADLVCVAIREIVGSLPGTGDLKGPLPELVNRAERLPQAKTNEVGQAHC
jgi:hypothetical protein